MLRSLVGSEMCIRDSVKGILAKLAAKTRELVTAEGLGGIECVVGVNPDGASLNLGGEAKAGVDVLGEDSGGEPVLCVDTCLLYTSDAADEEDSVDLGGRRIIKKKKKKKHK
eukprot:TRINITY_DN1360_c0_g2_i5.p2 TRINITY_DN1360_c0_g2~~TRINITY_DN1360_c0_g2_i5.p2  ORF type:complete len:112 (-),score=39.59 TRINITY_DN1360_c0_g2_i5:62-397(-)